MVDKAQIKSIAQQYNWCQADVQRAIESSPYNPDSDEAIVACMIRYAGPSLLERNRRLGAQKGITTKQKKLIDDLINQLNEMKDFYANQYLPKLQATLHEQASYIQKLLQEGGSESNG